ncbi:MAG: GHMP kinase [Chloroflexaceae bacterium]|jgi:D-glycero-alpha-D-manno-heptose-7-phosphate kinase|nr:GHMP kinase [Chloroflexaceae bacterium]
MAFRINSAAPIRICDNGGWTDTWFAEYGCVFNIAVAPHVRVQLTATPRASAKQQVRINATTYGESFAFDLGQPVPERHRMLAAALEELPPPDEVAVDVTIASGVPGGAATGTSAAVCVALLGALSHLRGEHHTAHEIAYAAHRVETQRMGLQSGIQDQLCAAYGGINLIEMFEYPHASVSPLRVPEATMWELEHRLLLLFLGKTHSSSAVHEQVIRRLESYGGSPPQMEPLRQAARQARDALARADWVALGQAMQANTAAQAALHPALVGSEASEAIAIAQTHGVLGWKVNGAGGAGGSLTLLCDGEVQRQQEVVQALQQNGSFRVIPIQLDRQGLRVWA